MHKLNQSYEYEQAAAKLKTKQKETELMEEHSTKEVLLLLIRASTLLTEGPIHRPNCSLSRRN